MTKTTLPQIRIHYMESHAHTEVTKATCECGWEGPLRRTPNAALLSGFDHLQTHAEANR